MKRFFTNFGKGLFSRILTFYLIFSACSCYAVPKHLPVPRYVTIKFDKVNARTGPSKDCPIEWVFIKKGEPVEVVAEYDQWRKIVDIKGEGGWVHASGLNGKRSVIIESSSKISLFKNANNHSKIIAQIIPEMRCIFHKCNKDWCNISCKSYKGWVLRKALWGVYPDE